MANIEAGLAVPMSMRISPKSQKPLKLPKYQGNARNESTVDRNIRLANPNFRRSLNKQLNDGQATEAFEARLAAESNVSVDEL